MKDMHSALLLSTSFHRISRNKKKSNWVFFAACAVSGVVLMFAWKIRIGCNGT